MPRRKSLNIVWDYFKRSRKEFGEKRAQCSFCSNIYSYASTTHNLFQHLVRRHEVIFTTDNKDRNEAVWNYFTVGSNKATCNLCETNCPCYVQLLEIHLKAKHSDIYKTIRANSPEDSDHQEQDLVVSKESDHESGDKPIYVEQDAEGRLRCVVCRDVLSSSAEARKHMESEHPKMVVEQTSDNEAAETRDTDEDMFTEVIYLDEHAPNDRTKTANTAIRAQKIGNKRFRDSLSQKTRRRISESKRRDESSSSDDEHLRKLKRRYDAESRRSIQRKSFIQPKRTFPKSPMTNINHAEKFSDEGTYSSEEIKNFANYITCLLKTLNKETCTKLQLDIINLIMTAKLQEQHNNVVVLDSSVSIVESVPNAEFVVTPLKETVNASSSATQVAINETTDAVNNIEN